MQDARVRRSRFRDGNVRCKGNVATRIRREGDERERARVPIHPRVHFRYFSSRPRPSRALVHRNTNYLHCEIMARDVTAARLHNSARRDGV